MRSSTSHPRNMTWKAFASAVHRPTLLRAIPKTNILEKISGQPVGPHLGATVQEHHMAEKIQRVPWDDSRIDRKNACISSTRIR